MRTRLAAAVVAAFVAVTLSGACGGGDDAASGTAGAGGSSVGGEHDHAEVEEGDGSHEPPAFEAGAADTALDVTLQDYAFVGVPDTVAGPKVFFAATIKGSNAHELEVLDGSGEAVDEIPAFKGDKTKELAVELAPGTYTLQCLVQEGSRNHAQLGMKKTFTVTG